MFLRRICTNFCCHRSPDPLKSICRFQREAADALFSLQRFHQNVSHPFSAQPVGVYPVSQVEALLHPVYVIGVPKGRIHIRNAVSDMGIPDKPIVVLPQSLRLLPPGIAKGAMVPR